MKPIKFSKYNQTAKAHDPDIGDLHVLTSRYSDGNPEIISCWQLSWWERLIILFRGKLLIHALTVQPPSFKPSVEFSHVRQVEQWYEKNN